MNHTRTPAARGWLLLFVLLALLAEVLLITALRPHGGANIVALELAPSADAFSRAVQRDWTQDASTVQAEPLCGLGLPHTVQATPRTSLGKLRCNLALDSLALVPGYVGLLLIFTLGLLPRGTSRLRRLAWCLPAIAAGAADLLENGLTLQALALLGQPELGDGLIGAVRGASQAKWLLLAVALAALGHLLWHTPAAGVTLRRIAALSCATAALALPLGAWWWQGAIGVGMAAMVLAFALLAWRAWRDPTP
jgi:hypothetical protein